MGLFDFLSKLPTRNEMSGNLGEWLTKVYAGAVPGALVLQDVLIDGADGYTSQIDVLLIGNKGIYVTEVKLFTDAKIYGDGNKSKWYYYNHGKKYEIYSPLKQNQKHIEYLKAFLREPFGEVPCFSILAVLCEDFKVTNINPSDAELTAVICSSLPAMERGVYKIAKDKPVVWDDEKKKAVFDYIQAHQHIGKDARQAHKQQASNYKTGLEEMKKQKLCPYCKRQLVLRNGKYGAFYGCSNYPDCKYTLKMGE